YTDLSITRLVVLSPILSSFIFLRSVSSFIYLSSFFNAPATTEIYTLSLHDALPTLDLARTDGQACCQGAFVIQKLSAVGDIAKAGTDRGLGGGDACFFDEGL